MDNTTSGAGETDEQLMAAFARGAGSGSGRETGREAADAFQTLFRRYRQAGYGFFRRRVGDAALAEELAQETFLGGVEGGGRYEATAAFRGYLYGIAFRVLKAHRRKAVLRAMFTGKMPERGEPAGAGAE